MTRLFRSRGARVRRPVARVLTAWSALLCLTAASTAEGGLLTRMATSVRRRLREVRAARDAGLTTVEVAIITAVLLGLATALVAAITVVVNRNISQIQ
jgi:hypothetical protein